MLRRVCLLCLTCLPTPACDKSSREAKSDAKGEDSGPASNSEGSAECDQVALTRLATKLEKAQPRERVAMVAEGVATACKASLSPTVAHYLGEVDVADADKGLGPGKDPAFLAAQQRVCKDNVALAKRLTGAPMAEYAKIAYEVCDYARFDLLTAAEAQDLGGMGWFTWTTHQMLLDADTPAEVAKPISRAMMIFEQVTFGPQLFRLPKDHRLAVVPHAQPVRNGVPIYLSATELSFNESHLATLKDGELLADDVKHHLVRALFDPLGAEAEKGRGAAQTTGEAWDGRAILVVDERVQFGSLVDVMYTAIKAEFSNYDLLVEAEFPTKRAIPISPPQFMGLEQQSPRELRVFILEEGYWVSTSGALERTTIPKLDPAGTTIAAWDTEALLAKATEIQKGEPTLTRATVSAETPIRFGVVAGTLSTLMGGTCATEDDCLFSTLLIEAGAG